MKGKKSGYLHASNVCSGKRNVTTQKHFKTGEFCLHQIKICKPMGDLHTREIRMVWNNLGVQNKSNLNNNCVIFLGYGRGSYAHYPSVLIRVGDDKQESRFNMKTIDYIVTICRVSHQSKGCTEHSEHNMASCT